MPQEAQITDIMPNLRKFALKLTKNQHDADDLLQTTVLRAIEKAHMFNQGTNLFSWSSKIMFNIFVSGYRRRTKFDTQYDPENYIANMSVEPEQEKKLELSQVRHAMKQLSAEHREILLLVCIQGMKYNEVSEVLQLPVGTVRSRLSRARERLQGELESPRRFQHPQLPVHHNRHFPVHGLSAAAA